MILIWDLMRTAAIQRHRILHNFLHDEWEPHMVVVRAFYGY